MSRIQYSYDTEAGVLYLSLGPPERATGHEEFGILMRTSEATGKPCGVTLINYNYYNDVQKIKAASLVAKFLGVDRQEIDNVFSNIA